jgi:hypothetical protein
VVAVAGSIVVLTYLLGHDCTPSQNADEAHMLETVGKRGHGIFAFEDEDERYAEDGEDKAYEVDGEALEDGGDGADVR